MNFKDHSGQRPARSRQFSLFKLRSERASQILKSSLLHLLDADNPETLAQGDQEHFRLHAVFRMSAVAPVRTLAARPHIGHAAPARAISQKMIHPINWSPSQFA